ncbi:hypothetical protein M440DRAFT_1160937 [Trichoderma longibrachiatum ATCC 18648]|uniref:Uncharacterized protein n=1 Tax=Trichoderma longibrachiatum ATCC 18648 TaxID=983965 RepID=A0A2T4CC23_TRILO|nr:hypothetical protein M440DRAFT_1160937 [Trichoderma longibrachiatum ATCC 18648]
MWLYSLVAEEPGTVRWALSQGLDSSTSPAPMPLAPVLHCVLPPPASCSSACSASMSLLAQSESECLINSHLPPAPFSCLSPPPPHRPRSGLQSFLKTRPSASVPLRRCQHVPFREP